MSRKQTLTTKSKQGNQTSIILFYPFYSLNLDQRKYNTSSIYDVDAHKQRVTQTNMIYLIGLPENIAHQDILRKQEYCGQYGKITKALIKNNYMNDFSSYSGYVTYESEESASLAILGLNNLTIQRNKIYASYGTNKYCSTFIRFGKCKKYDCPFLHKIQKHKEINEEDNKKLFQDQQQLARKYLIDNYKNITFTDLPNAVFPSKHRILQWFIEDGSIVVEDQIKKKEQDEQNTPRMNAMKQNICNDSEISTESSPSRGSQEIIQSNESKIKKRITQKVKCRRSSLFNFVNAHSTSEYEIVTNQLKQYLLQSIL